MDLYAINCFHIHLCPHPYPYPFPRLDTLNRSCLYWAVKNGQYDATRLLIHLGLDAEQKDIQDTSPLELAFLLGHDRIFQFLVQKKGKKRILPEQTNMSICIPDPLYTPPLYA
ncbi:ankyrin repeat domain-containing protein, partial [archaeon]